MKKIIMIQVLLISSTFSFAQNIDNIINAAEVGRIEKILSADSMQGRKTFTPGIDKAADFIASEFAKSKLTFLKNTPSYFQAFVMTKAKSVEIKGLLGTDSLNENNVAVNTTLG